MINFYQCLAVTIKKKIFDLECCVSIVFLSWMNFIGGGKKNFAKAAETFKHLMMNEGAEDCFRLI